MRRGVIIGNMRRRRRGQDRTFWTKEGVQALELDREEGVKI